jgi:hypothetical protein
MLKHLVRFNCALLAAGGVICLYALGSIIVPLLRRTKDLSSVQPDGAPDEIPKGVIDILKRLDLITVYFLVSVLSLIGLAKQGAATNYLLEPHIAISLFLCIRLGNFITRAASQAAAPGRLMMYVLLIALLYTHAINLHQKQPILFYPHNPDLTDMKKASVVLNAVREQPGDVLSEFPIFNIMAGKQVLFHPFIMSQLAREGKWNQAPFVRDIRAQRFDVVITTQDIMNPQQFFSRYTPEMLEALRRFYQPYYSEHKALDFGRGTLYYLYIPGEKAE